MQIHQERRWMDLSSARQQSTDFHCVLNVIKCRQSIIMTDRAMRIKKEKWNNKTKASGTGMLKGMTLSYSHWWRHHKGVYLQTPGYDRSLKVTVDWGCLCWIVRKVNAAFPTMESGKNHLCCKFNPFGHNAYNCTHEVPLHFSLCLMGIKLYPRKQ